MGETVLTLLVGGRGNLPNIWSVLAYKPTKVYVLAPTGDDGNTGTLCTWLNSRKVAHELVPQIDAYDCVGAETACTKIITRHADAAHVLFNMTQAPKLMAIGAAYACVLSRCARVCAFHRETSSGKTHSAWGDLPEERAAALTVDDYFLAYGRRTFDTFFPEQLPCSFVDLETIARNFAFDLRAFTSLMAYLKQPENLKVQNAILRAAPSPGEWSEKWEPLLSRMAHFGLIRDLAMTGSQRGFRLADTHVWSFLNGTWLEVYARSCAAKSVDPQTRGPLFSDCRMAVAIDTDDASNELDLAAVDSAGLLLFASCKAGKNFDTRALNEIVDRSSLFGHGYCAKALITSRSGDEVDKVSGMRDQAAARSVPIITGEMLPTLGERLSQIMSDARLRAR